MSSNTITAVFTKWGWVSQGAMYRFKEAHATAVRDSQTLFTLDGSQWDTRFIRYLLEFLENEGLVPVKPATDVTLFQQEEGQA